MSADERLVQKWGQRSIVTLAMLEDVSEDIVRGGLIAGCVRAAEQDGYTHLPGDEMVRFVKYGDPDLMFEDEVPEGCALAITTIRCYPTDAS